MAEIAARYAERARRSADLDGVSRRLRGLALQRAPVEHRAAAAALPRVAGVRARTWSAGATRCSRSSARERRRPERPRRALGPASDAAPPRSRRASTACRSRRRSRSGGSTRYLIEDDPLTLLDAGPNSGQGARRARAGARRARPPRRGPRPDPRQPPAHGPRRPRRHPRAGARAPRSPRSTCSRRGSRATASSRTPTTRSPAPSWRRNGIPEDTRLALRAVSHAFRGWGARADVTRAAAPTATRSSCATAR